MTRYIFVTGGVVSSLGKGILTASLAAQLESRQLKVNVLKMDPYINVDPGTMSPTQLTAKYLLLLMVRKPIWTWGITSDFLTRHES